MRGGGGNFGVVTSFLFKTHPIHTNYAGPMLWHIEDSVEVLKWYRKFITKAPREINGFFAYLFVPPGPPFPEHLHLKKMCGIVWCYTGPLKKAEKAFKPIRAFKTPALDMVGPIPHPVMQSMFDALFPPGLQWYWKADFVHELSDEAIALHHEQGSRMPTMLSTMHLYPIDGAAARVKNNAHGVGLSRRQVGGGHRRRRSRSGEQGQDHRVGQGLLGRAPSAQRARRVRELHDGHRGRGPREGELRQELRAARQDQEEVRPDQLLPGESEHQAREVEAGLRPACRKWGRLQAALVTVARMSGGWRSV